MVKDNVVADVRKAAMLADGYELTHKGVGPHLLGVGTLPRLLIVLVGMATNLGHLLLRGSRVIPVLIRIAVLELKADFSVHTVRKGATLRVNVQDLKKKNLNKKLLSLVALCALQRLTCKNM